MHCLPCLTLSLWENGTLSYTSWFDFVYCCNCTKSIKVIKSSQLCVCKGIIFTEQSYSVVLCIWVKKCSCVVIVLHMCMIVMIVLYIAFSQYWFSCWRNIVICAFVWLTCMEYVLYVMQLYKVMECACMPVPFVLMGLISICSNTLNIIQNKYYEMIRIVILASCLWMNSMQMQRNYWKIAICLFKGRNDS